MFDDPNTRGVWITVAVGVGYCIYEFFVWLWQRAKRLEEETWTEAIRTSQECVKSVMDLYWEHEHKIDHLLKSWEVGGRCEREISFSLPLDEKLRLRDQFHAEILEVVRLAEEGA